MEKSKGPIKQKAKDFGSAIGVPLPSHPQCLGASVLKTSLTLSTKPK